MIEKAKESELTGMTVEHEGKLYEIDSTHKEYQMDMVWDEDYYILTLAVLAKELNGEGLVQRFCHLCYRVAGGVIGLQEEPINQGFALV